MNADASESTRWVDLSEAQLDDKYRDLEMVKRVFREYINESSHEFGRLFFR